MIRSKSTAYVKSTLGAATAIFAMSLPVVSVSAAPSENAADPTITACEHAPDPQGLAVGLERRCPPITGSAGIARGDFNGDGIADLAIGAPGEDLPETARTTIRDAGVVHVIYGTAANGLAASATGIPTTQLLRQPLISATPTIETAEADDQFGASLASGDFNADGFSDLAVGAPGDGAPGTTAKGRVQIFLGSASGLSTTASATFGPALFSFADNPTVSHGATSLAWGDFNGDRFGDLAIASDYIAVDDGASPSVGTVTVLFGSATGLTTTGFFRARTESLVPDATQRTPLILTAGDFNRDGFFELVAGSPKRPIDGLLLAGGVSVLIGSASGLDVENQQNWHANLPNVPTDASTGDTFGQAVATGDMNGDGFADLAIGVPNERTGSLNGSGAVIVLYGSGSGLQAPASGNVAQLWSQNSTAAFSPAEAGDRFGTALAVGDFDGNGIRDLAISAPEEDLPAGTDAGVINVIYGTSSGLSVTSGTAPIAFAQSSFGESIEAGDRFGESLSAWNFGRSTHADLAIGAPLEDVGTLVDAGAMFVVYGGNSGLRPALSTTQVWTQNTANVPDSSEAGDKFGQAAY